MHLRFDTLGFASMPCVKLRLKTTAEAWPSVSGSSVSARKNEKASEKGKVSRKSKKLTGVNLPWSSPSTAAAISNFSTQSMSTQ